MVAEFTLNNPIIHSWIATTDPSRCIGPAMVYGWWAFRNNGPASSFKANPIYAENGAHRVVTSVAGIIGNRTAWIVYDLVVGAF